MPAEPSDGERTTPAGDIAPGAMTEFLTDDWGFFVRSSRQFEKFSSPFQRIEVHDSATFGKLFRLDGCFMTSERDEFFYHENLVHVAAVTHPRPERALVVGGGDGGSAEELLKHPSIKSVTLAEIDLAVVDISANISRASSRRVRRSTACAEIEDGFAYVRNSTEQFDLIVLDLTDAGGPSTTSTRRSSMTRCAARLAPMGAMTLHSDPIAHPERIRASRESAQRFPGGRAVSDVDPAVRRHG
jgi:spermidine synthase